ncbi:MAG: polysaccharide lyase 8 family protein [Cellulosilyticaceae bacterium]
MTMIYQELRIKWVNKLTGNNVSNRADVDYQAAMRELEEKAQGLWESIEVQEKGKWKGLDIINSPADTNIMIRHLEVMATAYAAEGCQLYHNNSLKEAIIEALESMHTYGYNEHMVMIANWWNWDIGIPQALGNVIILLFSELSKDYIERQLITLKRFNPTPFAVPGGPKMTGANLLDTAVVSMLKGMIGEDEKALVEARDAISEVLPYVINGDGFYVDGSFIQHGNVPYAGGYGAVLMECMAKLLFILDGTPWQVVDPLIENVYNWITESFAPLYHQGAIMDMVGGRGVSRQELDDHKRGRAIIPPMLELSYTAPKQKALEIQRFIKDNIIQDRTYENYYSDLKVTDILNIKALLADEEVETRQGYGLHKMYSSMDRVVHHRNGWAVGISMFSSRIDNFEYGNGEHSKGYHTSDGMISLYNDDQSQFADHYWPTADMMRLPGTTTDQSECSVIDWRGFRSQQDWVGGTNLDNQFGISGMILEMERTSLKAKKSWICLADKIVCLGSGITAADNQLVETIVENRKIKQSGDNKLIINGEEVLEKLGQEDIVNQVQWAWLEGNTVEGCSHIGYYFPKQTDVRVIRETRRGSWKDINIGGSEEVVCKNYISLAISHGENPSNETYSYILLPNTPLENIATYKMEEEIEIIANSDKVQAIRYFPESLVGINFWEQAEIEGIYAAQPCTCMIREKKEELELVIADPTQNQETLTILFKNKQYQLKEKLQGISLEICPEGTKITLGTKASAGKTYRITFIK